VKTRTARHNNRKKLFEIPTSTTNLVFPCSKAEPTPTIHNPIAEIYWCID